MNLTYKKLDEVCEILDSQRVPITASERKAGQYPYYGANGVQDYVADFIFDDELVLLAEDGGNFGSKERPIAYRVSGKCWVNNHAHVLKPRPEIDVDYLCYALMFYDTTSLVNGATRQKLTQAAMRQMKIPFRSMKEQKTIVQKISAAASLITIRKTQLQKLDQLASSRFIEMFGDPVANPKGWSIKKIKEVVAKQKNALKAGPFGSALKKEFYTPSGYKIYGQEQVINGDAEFGDYYISQEKYAELKSCAIQAKDVLISLVGTYGKTLVVPDEFEPGIINPRLIKITFDQSVINVSYFQAYFSSESLKAYLDVQTHGCTMGVLNLGIISNLLIPLPPLSLQNEFAAFVEQLDKSKVTIRKSIEKLETTYRALLQEYFG